MKNKVLIAAVAVITLFAFTGATTAQAFVDPATLSIILGAAFLAGAGIVNIHRQHDAETAKVDVQQPPRAQSVDTNAPQTHADTGVPASAN